MSNEGPDKQPTATYSVLSLVVSGLTALIGGSVLISGRGAGMEALSMLLPLIVLGGGGFLTAFALGLIALGRGEEPRILGILAVCIPPVAGFLAPALGR